MISKIDDLTNEYNFVFSKPIRIQNNKRVKQSVTYSDQGLLKHICTYSKETKSLGSIQSSLILVGKAVLELVPLNRKIKVSSRH